MPPSQTSESPKLDESAGAELLSQIEDKRAELSSVYNEMSPVIDGLTEEQQRDLGTGINAVDEGTITVEEFIAKYTPGTVEATLATEFARAKKAELEIAELEERHKPYLMQEVSDLAVDITGRFNWEAALHYYDNLPKTNTDESDSWDNGLLANALATTMPIRQALVLSQTDNLASLDYSKLQIIRDSAIGSIPEWEKRGFLYAVPREKAQEPAESPDALRLRVKSDLEGFNSAISKYTSLKRQFRSSFTNSHESRWFFGQLVTELDIENTGGAYQAKLVQAYGLDPAFIEAVDIFVQQKIDKYISEDPSLQVSEPLYQERVTRLRGVSAEKAVRSINIEGFAANVGEVLVVTEEDFRKELGELVPACFLDKVRVVVVTVKPEGLNKDDPDVETIGLHTPEFDDKGNLVSSLIEIYENPAVAEGSNKITKEYTKSEFLFTALHEVGHSIHSNIDYVDMLEWERVIQIDDKAVTSYVAHSREKGEKKGLQEDFCETFALAVCNPGELVNKSRARFDYMMRLVGKYMGDEQRDTFLKVITEKLEAYNRGILEAQEYLKKLEEEEGEENE